MELRILLQVTFQLQTLTILTVSAYRSARPNKGRLSRIEPNNNARARSFQVLNQPKHGLPSNPNFSTWIPTNRPTTTCVPKGQTRRTTQKPEIKNPLEPILDFPEPIPSEPLLDFPDFHFTEPILDFPDPVSAPSPPATILDEYYKYCQQNISKGGSRAKTKRGGRARQATNVQNRQLLHYFLRNAIEESPVPEHEPIHGLRLLQETVDIFKEFCPNQYVPARFLDNAVRLFRKLHILTSPGRTEYLAQSHFNWTLNILRKCRGRRRVPYFSDGCSEEIVGYKSKKNWLCPPPAEAFNPQEYDPLLDIIWHAYNAVQSYCFQNFHESYRMFHKYGMGIMDLYSEPIKIRWKYKRTSGLEKGFSFWERLLGPHYELYLRNIERCTHAATLSSTMFVRRPRFMYSGSLRLNYEKLPIPSSKVN